MNTDLENYGTTTSPRRAFQGGGRCARLFLAIAGLALATAKGEVRVQSFGGNNHGSADLSYSTGGGLALGSQTGGGAQTYSPDNLPGHQLFTTQVTVSNTALLTRATADLPRGLLRSATAVDDSGGTAIMGSGAQVLDEITFNNTTGQPATITVSWRVEGALTVPNGSTFSRASYHHDLILTGPGVIARFEGRATMNNDPKSNTAEFNSTGWESSSIEPINQHFGGVRCTGTLLLPGGERTLNLSGLIETGVSSNAVASADFGNTAALTFTLPQGVSFTSRDGVLKTGSRMVNISTRAHVLSGDSVAIGGFIVTGTVPKRVIIRGIGPSLGALGVTGVLSDPTLELVRNGVVLAANDNWRETQESEIVATGIPPGDNLEAAIVRTLDPGSYTAILRGKNNGTGIGLVEVYDLQASADSRLANISTRAVVEAGDNVLIGGIIGGGNGSQPRVLIRAIGPSLANFGVPNALQDPLLELHDSNGALINSNNDWQSDHQAEIQATGLAPTNPLESAILATLLPTNYTAIIRGANNSTGVALVEAYHLQ